MRMTRNIAAVSLLALAAAGCTTFAGEEPSPAAAVTPPSAAAQRADVNPGYRAGSVNIPTKPTASLEQVLAKTAAAPKREAPKDGEDRLRRPAMQEAAIAYGARAGLAWTTRQINATLDRRSAELAKSYDFQRLMIQGPNGVMVMPPVIVEAVDAWESFDAGKTLRVADTVYEIVEQSRFTSVAPMWQAYLISDFEEAEVPPDALLPRDAAERESWNRWVREGWKKGVEQAEETFQANLDRLNRDYTGMVRYRVLLEERKVSAPVLAEGNLGTTGTGQDMRVNDRALRITRDPLLQVNPTGWEASATAEGPEGKPEGPAVQQPKSDPRPAPAPRPAARTATPRPAAKPVEEPTSGGEGRF